jgi:uncharacterized cupredoxin-like copper-binding protein
LAGQRFEEANLRSRLKPLLVLAVLALLLIAVAGCGSKKKNNASSTATTTPTTQTSTTSSGGTGAGSKLKVAADPSGALKFDKSKLNAKAGNVTITMDNPSPVLHGIGIKGNGVTKTGASVSKGGVSTVSASLKPGTYQFYCPVDGHAQAGMQGTLTVK